MPKAIETLKYRAKQSALTRGHKLGKWRTTQRSRPGVAVGAVSQCTCCAGWVQVLVHPAPNDIDVGGTAVALECPIPQEGTA